MVTSTTTNVTTGYKRHDFVTVTVGISYGILSQIYYCKFNLQAHLVQLSDSG